MPTVISTFPLDVARRIPDNDADGALGIYSVQPMAHRTAGVALVNVTGGVSLTTHFVQRFRDLANIGRHFTRLCECVVFGIPVEKADTNTTDRTPLENQQAITSPCVD